MIGRENVKILNILELTSRGDRRTLKKLLKNRAIPVRVRVRIHVRVSLQIIGNKVQNKNQVKKSCKMFVSIPVHQFVIVIVEPIRPFHHITKPVICLFRHIPVRQFGEVVVKPSHQNINSLTVYYLRVFTTTLITQICLQHLYPALGL